MVAQSEFAHSDSAAKASRNGIWPGLVLAAAIAAAAFGLRQIPMVGVLSPMILAITIGVAVRNIVGEVATGLPASVPVSVKVAVGQANAPGSLEELLDDLARAALPGPGLPAEDEAEGQQA